MGLFGKQKQNNNPVSGEGMKRSPSSGEPVDPTAATRAASNSASRNNQVLTGKLAAASLGEIILVMMSSPAYEDYTLADLKWLLIPPLKHNQFLLADGLVKDSHGQEKLTALGVLFWASVSPEIDQKLTDNLAKPFHLQADEWHSGEIIWVIDAVGKGEVVKSLLSRFSQDIVKGRDFKTRTRDEEGNPYIHIQKGSQ